MNQKDAVRQFWDRSSCGETLLLHGINEKEAFINQTRLRYILEPYILSFAGFDFYKEKDGFLTRALKTYPQCGKKQSKNTVSIKIGNNTDVEPVDISFFPHIVKNVGY